MENFDALLPKEQLNILIAKAAQEELLKKAVFSKPADKSVLRMVATVRKIGGANMLQCEYFMSDNKALHKNLTIDGTLTSELDTVIDGFSQINLLTTAGDAEYKLSKSGKSVLLNGKKLFAALNSNRPAEKVAVSGNDRKKEHILCGDEPFLVLLGVSDANGRIFDKKRSKFRQINRFLEMIRDVLPELPTGEICIADLCCGKSYLSFAAYHYFANILGYKVTMVGADLKSDVIAYCSDVAKRLSFDGLTFVCTDIKKYDAPRTPDLVISLHACDTATDIVLDKAVEWGARVILSTPCCHHELNHSLNCPAVSFIADYSMLRQKFCDAATDALRLKRLESEGYTCEALELIDPDETPKNIMLRAIKKKNFNKDSKEAKAALAEYESAKRFLLGDKK